MGRKKFVFLSSLWSVVVKLGKEKIRELLGLREYKDDWKS